jgi:DNA-binding LacI/PurR family transcriptional regulator
MARKRVTIRDVAQRARVSPTTVSFVLNDVQGPSLRKETRQRVIRAARELGYAPSAAARSLITGQTYSIGLIIFSAEQLQVDAYQPQMLYSLNQVSREHGFRVLLELLEDTSQPQAYLELVHSKQIDGLVVMNRREDDTELLALIESAFPIVLIGRMDHPSACYVGIDEVGMAEKATTHLLSLDHRRVAYLSYAPRSYLGARARLLGYRRALQKAGLPFDESLVAYGDHSAESGYREMLGLLQIPSRPTALFAGNDTVAFGAMAAIREQGLRIPEDVAVVGYDDIPKARFATPPLTTISSKPVEVGRRAGEMLIDLIQGKEPQERQVTLEAEFIIRESCGARKASKR